jgi:fatty-acyl-CoA synthase
VLNYCRGEIAAYKVPSEVRIINTLPPTSTHKVQKFKLREMALQEIEQRQRMGKQTSRDIKHQTDAT